MGSHRPPLKETYMLEEGGKFLGTRPKGGSMTTYSVTAHVGDTLLTCR